MTWTDWAGQFESMKPICFANVDNDVVVFPGYLIVGGSLLVVDALVWFGNGYVDGCAVVAIDNKSDECFSCDGLTFPNDLEDYGGVPCIAPGAARLALLSPGVLISDTRFDSVDVVRYGNIQKMTLGLPRGARE